MSDEQCEEFRELVSAFVDERLDGAELLRLEEHFRACGGCRLFEGEVRRIRGLLQAAEAFHPPRRAPRGFAALVAARIAAPPGAQVIPFPAADAARRRPRGAWIPLVAAAAAAALLFAWSWQRLLPVNAPDQKMASVLDRPTVELASADGGSMDAWMREHAELARGGTLLGSAEESDLARSHASFGPER